MNKICRNYCNMIKEKFDKQIKSIVIYGSNIYDVNSSDLDVCLIIDNEDKELCKELIDATIKFHIDNNLKIDEEISFENKLVFTNLEIEETLNNPPFYINGKARISDIKKTSEFLNSKEMKQRLLLNIFTTDHLTYGESTIKYEEQAFKIIVNVVMEFYSLDNPTIHDVLDCLYKNKFTGADGEMYLGYKRKYIQKEKYLVKNIKKVLHNNL